MKKLIPCTKCNGSGEMELGDEMAETLGLVPKSPRSISTAELEARLPGVNSTAQSNRLERLRRIGLVSREKMGRFWRYSRAERNGRKAK